MNNPKVINRVTLSIEGEKFILENVASNEEKFIRDAQSVVVKTIGKFKDEFNGTNESLKRILIKTCIEIAYNFEKARKAKGTSDMQEEIEKLSRMADDYLK